ncbi:MAG: hypothetical protein JJT94_15400 [Bernardetiaceae bacterium]|nr:hypothetical protein [Bernardetiaceae bacterium]
MKTTINLTEYLGSGRRTPSRWFKFKSDRTTVYRPAINSDFQSVSENNYYEC